MNSKMLFKTNNKMDALSLLQGGWGSKYASFNRSIMLNCNLGAPY